MTEGTEEIAEVHMVPGHRCLRCGKEWVPRREGRPVRCPGCGSPYWDRERERPVPQEEQR